MVREIRDRHLAIGVQNTRDRVFSVLFSGNFPPNVSGLPKVRRAIIGFVCFYLVYYDNRTLCFMWSFVRIFTEH